MESLRRFLNPLVLNLQKMELELTCPVCLKLLSAPTTLPCCHTSCSKCATTPTTNGYSCAICKSGYRSQDLSPASHLEAIVNIHRSLSSTVSTMVQQQDTQVHILVARAASQGTPESGNRSGVDKSDQMKSYNPVASKLVYNQSTGPVFENMDGVQARDPAFESKAADAAVQTVLVQKGHSGSQSSDSPGDLDCDSYDLEGELITNRSVPQTALKKAPNVMDDNARELKRQKSIDQGERQPIVPGAWKCEFCHSSKITEFTGPLSHYLHGEPLEANQAWKSNVLHVHEKCIEWAPQAFFTGDIANNLEPELARASKIKCSVCGSKGAALGCLVKSCRKSYHVPCAHVISGCRWDEENFVMLCPAHSSKKLLCERSKSKKKTKLQQSSSDIMLDDLSSPSPILMEGDELWTASPFLTSEWVICGSALNSHDKEILDQFEHQTGITVTNNWMPNVTHVIANTDERGACSRTLKVLMAILAGKWVLNVNWLKACIEAREPVPEAPYEISSDVHGSFDGPRTGRLRAMQQASSLFSGLTFYFSGHFLPAYKVHLEDLIAAAEGSILEKTDLSSTSLIVYSMEPPQGSDPDTLNEVINKRIAEAEELAATIGCKIIIRSHPWVLRSDGTNVMAFFNSGSRTLVEILTRMQSAERPMPVDHTFFEFGSIRYHVEASASDPENVYLSISTPSLSHEASPSTTGLPEFTLQETRKMYQKFAEIMEPPKEGYVLTLKLNFSGLTRPKAAKTSHPTASACSSRRSDQGHQPDIAAAVRGPELAAEGHAGEPRLVRHDEAREQPTGLVLRQQDGWEDKRNLPHAFQGRHGPGYRHLLLSGAAGPRELVREGAQVQLVADPAAAAAGRVRAPPHHQRRLRLLRSFVAARPGEAGRQDGVDPAQLPGLRQAPHQVHPELHPEQDERAPGDPDGGDPQREATGER